MEIDLRGIGHRSVIAVRISEECYQRIALADPEGKWELDCGRLQSKPPMTYAHNHLAWMLGVWLQSQLEMREFEARGDSEIWRIHLLEHTLIAWRRQPDGSYGETLNRDGILEPLALAGVRIDLDRLFAG